MPTIAKVITAAKKIFFIAAPSSKSYRKSLSPANARSHPILGGRDFLAAATPVTYESFYRQVLCHR